jgi:CheY-like chemotaxis protein
MEWTTALGLAAASAPQFPGSPYEASRDMVVDVLQFAGATVRACGDAYAALNNLNQFRTDVIVCDLALPGMDGLNFLYALRAHHDGNVRCTPMLAVTGYDEIYSPQQFLRLGCEGYMMKPLSLDRLCAAVHKLAGLTAPGAKKSEAA